MIRIKAKRDGFRRAGRAHPARWVEYPDSEFTPEELRMLLSEPMLEVEVVEEEKQTVATKKRPSRRRKK